jgi:hypothetical protein
MVGMDIPGPCATQHVTGWKPSVAKRHTPSQVMQAQLKARFGLAVSISQINRIRRALGVSRHAPGKRASSAARPLLNLNGRNRHPERVRALLLVDSGGFVQVSRFFCWLLGQEWISRLIAVRLAKVCLKRRTPLVERILARIGQDRAIPSWVAVNAAIWRSFASPEHDLRSQAASIVAPTQFIYGRFDPII